MKSQKLYQGIYTPKNPEKYRGDVKNIVYRSSWERSIFRWCDENPNVEYFSSEEVVIPYICKTDGKRHRYFVDLLIKFQGGKILLVEIKPEHYTKQPKPISGKPTARFLNDVLRWTKNTCKWNAAIQYAEKNNMQFCVWTEKSLRKLGIKIIT